MDQPSSIYHSALCPIFLYVHVRVVSVVCIFLQRQGMNLYCMYHLEAMLEKIKTHFMKKETTWVTNISTSKTRSVDYKFPRPQIVLGQLTKGYHYLIVFTKFWQWKPCFINNYIRSSWFPVEENSSHGRCYDHSFDRSVLAGTQDIKCSTDCWIK